MRRPARVSWRTRRRESAAAAAREARLRDAPVRRRAALYEQLLADPSVPANEIDLEGHLDDYLELVLRVRGEPARALARARGLRDAQGSVAGAARELRHWQTSLRAPRAARIGAPSRSRTARVEIARGRARTPRARRARRARGLPRRVRAAPPGRRGPAAPALRAGRRLLPARRDRDAHRPLLLALPGRGLSRDRDPPGAGPAGRAATPTRCSRSSWWRATRDPPARTFRRTSARSSRRCAASASTPPPSGSTNPHARLRCAALSRHGRRLATWRIR